MRRPLVEASRLFRKSSAKRNERSGTPRRSVGRRLASERLGRPWRRNRRLATWPRGRRNRQGNLGPGSRLAGRARPGRVRRRRSSRPRDRRWSRFLPLRSRRFLFPRSGIRETHCPLHWRSNPRRLRSRRLACAALRRAPTMLATARVARPTGFESRSHRRCSGRHSCVRTSSPKTSLAGNGRISSARPFRDRFWAILWIAHT